MVPIQAAKRHGFKAMLKKAEFTVCQNKTFSPKQNPEVGLWMWDSEAATISYKAYAQHSALHCNKLSQVQSVGFSGNNCRNMVEMAINIHKYAFISV